LLDRGRRALGAACLACLLAAPAAQADGVIDRAAADIAAGNAQAAYDLLSPLEPDRAGDPEFDYLLGIAALDIGRATEAVFALERVLAMQPENLPARAELARALLALDEVESARVEFDTVSRADGIPPEARATIDSYLAALRDAPWGRAGKGVRAFIAAGYGYDSNVVASSDALGVGSGIVGLLPPQSDTFGRFSGGVTARYPVRPNLAFLGAVNGFARFNSNLASNDAAAAALFERNVDQVDFNGFVGVEYLRGMDAWSLSLQGDHFRSGNDAFRNAFGGTLQVRRRLDSVSHVTGYAQYSRLTYQNASFRNVNRWSGGLSYARVFPVRLQPVAYAGVYGGTEQNLAAASGDLAHDFIGARLGVTLSFRRDVSASASFNYEHRSYHAFDRVWAFFTGEQIRRADDRFYIRAAVDFEPGRLWFVTPSYEYNLNDSNLPTVDYVRHVGMLTVRREFR
jgi:hypothetical protein